MGRITSFSKQVIVFFLVTALMIRPTFAAVGGWDLKNPVAQGASTVYDATKNVVINGKKFIKESSVKITPTATQVAKTIGRTAGVIVAIEMLIGAVDWVLDPANNRVIYHEGDPPTVLLPKLWVWDARMEGKNGVATAEQACKKNAFPRELAQQYNSYKYTVYKSVTITGEDSARCFYDVYNTFTNVKYDGTDYHDISRKVNTAYNPDAVDDREEKYLPYDVVAQQLISNAETGQPDAQAHTMAAAATAVAEAETDNTKARPIVNQAEANAETKPADVSDAETANEAQGQTKPNEANPDLTDIALEFPVFCNWAPTICEAAQTVISFPQTLTNWWETGKTKAEEWATSISEAWTKVKEEYADKPEENTDTELDIPDQSPPDINTDISFGGSCPASRSVPVSFAGISTEIEFSFQWFCEVASIAKPVVISISAFAAALIVAGVRTEDD